MSATLQNWKLQPEPRYLMYFFFKHQPIVHCKRGTKFEMKHNNAS